MSAPVELPERTGQQHDDDLVHVFCCDPNRSLCGLDITTAKMAPNATLSEVCVVCVDLEPLRCPQCKGGEGR